ncbi:DUF3040 domain-containing protein [Pseudonocardia sp. H11422]|uniref:DUF3040 domain-containing protein n=1 Tax=Pseudonocardia sp. H11422 TaxID=2835866 RepID=UPI0027E2B168|nr:DUF3040 domain-containing protein [Pseudonocardia sp. H11422]
MPLSPREQRILAGIEDQLGQMDPALAATFARTRLPSSSPRRWFPRWFPLPAAHTGLLVLVLLVAHPLALELGPAGVGLLTAAMVVPWMVSAAWAGTGSRSGCGKRRRRGPLIKAPNQSPKRTAWLHGVTVRQLVSYPKGRVSMVALIVVLLLVWLALAVLGAVIEGLFWLTIVGVVLFLGTTAYAAIKRRTGRQIH